MALQDARHDSNVNVRKTRYLDEPSHVHHRGLEPACRSAWPNGLRLTGERSRAKRVRCSRGLGDTVISTPVDLSPCLARRSREWLSGPETPMLDTRGHRYGPSIEQARRLSRPA